MHRNGERFSSADSGITSSFAETEPGPLNTRSTKQSQAAESNQPTSDEPLARSVSFSFNDGDPGLEYIRRTRKLGTLNPAFVKGLVHQLAGVASLEPDDQTLNFMLSVITDLNPQDHLETMLATQMAILHVTIMRLSCQLPQAKRLDQQNSSGSLLNKCMRTFTLLADTLKRHRMGNEQKITVHHVSVNEGGQAIVGNVNHTAAGKPVTQTVAPPALIAQENQSPMAPLDQFSSESPVQVRRR